MIIFYNNKIDSVSDLVLGDDFYIPYSFNSTDVLLKPFGYIVRTIVLQYISKGLSMLLKVAFQRFTH